MTVTGYPRKFSSPHRIPTNPVIHKKQANPTRRLRTISSAPHQAAAQDNTKNPRPRINLLIGGWLSSTGFWSLSLHSSAPLVRSFKANRINARATVRAARAAERAAVAAQAGSDLARSSLDDLQRAYLYIFEINEIDIQFILKAPLAIAISGSPFYPSARMFLKNYGKTPANIVSAGMIIDVTRDIPEKNRTYNYPTAHAGRARSH